MMTKLYVQFVNGLVRMKSRKGQTLVEYGLILALVAIVVIAILTLMGSQLRTIFGKITATLSQASGS
jgi:pilus assembly protein Flp/PilA